MLIKRKQEWWDTFFMNAALHFSMASKDPDRKVGAVIVSPDRRTLVWGFNGFPTGVPDYAEDLRNLAKRSMLMLHAERNAMDNAECSLRGFTLYVTKAPCMECAKGIVQNRIARVVAPPFDLKGTWGSSQAHAICLFAQVGVVVDTYSEISIP